MESFYDTCRDHSLRLTPQKVEVYRVLASTDAHPFAEDILSCVQKKFSNISFATVYKNLKKFVDIGAAIELDFGDGKSRFDANMDNHHHVINLDTKGVHDIEMPEISKISLPEKFQSLKLEKVNLSLFVRNE